MNTFRDFRNKKTEVKVMCPYCNVQAKWCENKEKYGKNYWKSYMCYYCKDCDAYVGCHNNTREPLGTMANDELRKARMRVHNTFLDPIWKEWRRERKEIYNELNNHFWREVHIGQTTVQECNKIADYLKEKYYQ